MPKTKNKKGNKGHAPNHNFNPAKRRAFTTREMCDGKNRKTVLQRTVFKINNAKFSGQSSRAGKFGEDGYVPPNFYGKMASCARRSYKHNGREVWI